MNKYISQIFIITLILLAIFKNSFSGSPPRFTCKNYLLNAYLYIFLSAALIFLLTNIYANNKVPALFQAIKFSIVRFFIFLFLSLLLLYVVMTWSPKDILGKHAIWLVWIAMMAYILYPMLLVNPQLFQHVKIITMAVMTILTLFTFISGSIIQFEIICFIALIISVSSSPANAVSRIFSSFTRKGLYVIVSGTEIMFIL